MHAPAEVHAEESMVSWEKEAGHMFAEASIGARHSGPKG